MVIRFSLTVRFLKVPGASSSPQRTLLHVQKAMSKSLSRFGSHCSLVAFRALSRAISENVDQPLLSLISIAFGPQTIGSFNSLLEVDHRSAISRATLQKISCIETLRGFLSCIRI